jgi:5-methylcytosine-specific restriction protein A
VSRMGPLTGNDMAKLQSLKPRLSTIPGRLQLAATLSTQRMRGRAAVDRRKRWLDQHPLCCMCEAEGIVRAGDVVDHVIPLWKGGRDDDSNLQTLCQTPHHDEKSKREAAERASGG